MGNYSTLQASTIPTEYKTQKEIDTRINKILKMPKFHEIDDHEKLYYIPNSKTTQPRVEHLNYTFELIGTNIDIVPIDGDYYGKHYDDAALAFVISKLITPKGKAYIEYIGDEGSWGFAIEKDKTRVLHYQIFIMINNKKTLLDKWLQEDK